MREQIRKVLHSSAKDDWGTPEDFFHALHAQYKFTFDLCATAENALLPRFCAHVQSGMLIDTHWADTIPIDWQSEIFFCNPPYGRKLPEILRAIPHHARGVFLLPSRTGSHWWHDLLERASWVCFLRGRLKFKGAGHPAPFDSALMGLGVGQPCHMEEIYHGWTAQRKKGKCV